MSGAKIGKADLPSGHQERIATYFAAWLQEVARWKIRVGPNRDEVAPLVLRERALLCGRDTAFTQYEAADGAAMFEKFVVARTGAQAINPSAGLEAEA